VESKLFFNVGFRIRDNKNPALIVRALNRCGLLCRLIGQSRAKQQHQYKQAQQHFRAGVSGFILSRDGAISISLIADASNVIAGLTVRATSKRMTRKHRKGQAQHEQTNG
jgi:hypothetical protein